MVCPKLHSIHYALCTQLSSPTSESVSPSLVRNWSYDGWVHPTFHTWVNSMHHRDIWSTLFL